MCLHKEMPDSARLKSLLAARLLAGLQPLALLFCLCAWAGAPAAEVSVIGD